MEQLIPLRLVVVSYISLSRGNQFTRDLKIDPGLQPGIFYLINGDQAGSDVAVGVGSSRRL